MAKLDAQNSGLDFIEAAVPAWFVAEIFSGLAMVA
jgi:hypothetical protein